MKTMYGDNKNSIVEHSSDPAGHLFVSMCDLMGVAVDYWWVSCRDTQSADSIGDPTQTLKKIWLKQWLTSSELKMPGSGIGDCELEPRGDSITLPTVHVTKKQFNDAARTVTGKLVEAKSNPEAYRSGRRGSTNGRSESEAAGEAIRVKLESAQHLADDDFLDVDTFFGQTVGRLIGLPEAVTKLGEPILCNVIPGGPEREHLERERGGKTLEDGYLQERVTELKILIRNWVKAVVELFHELGKPPKCGRVKPLLAMPLIGTGGGGGAMLTGLIANMIVELIPKLCEEFAVDILLCVSKESEYKLVQERRQKKEGAWGRLTASNKKCAEKLAGYARGNICASFLELVSVPLLGCQAGMVCSKK